MAAAVGAVALVALAYLIYRSKDRKRAALIVGLALAWVFGLGFAFAQFVPGTSQILPVPFALEGESSERVMTLAEAREAVSFPILAPSYLPSEFRLENVRVTQARGAAALVILSYYDDRTNSELKIWERRSRGPAVRLGESNLTIGGSYAKLTVSGDRTAIVWTEGQTTIELSGEYGKNEMIKTARSMGR
ncbi:MAG: DUF4367 domain-containing protein [Actinobacteria bacterium]|nr:MAG: DUF4367 domain-containing protein [Actinomycetota bacterium]